MIPCTTTCERTCAACLIGSGGNAEQKAICFLVLEMQDPEELHRIFEYVSKVFDRQK